MCRFQVLSAPIDEVMGSWNAVDPMSGAEVNELSLADARARIVESITSGAMTFPPYETDTWPACRPLVEWIVAMMPEEGSGYTRPEWSKRELATLTKSFFASHFGAPLDDEDHRSLLESILWFGTDYGPGDPLRWSPVAVEILLADWIPRKLVAPADNLSKAPTVLRAFVRYCHSERQIPQDLTDDTIEAIDQWEPDYQPSIGSPRHQGAMELLERLGLLPGMDGEWDAEDGPDGTEHLGHNEYILDSLARSVGGMRSSTNPLTAPESPTISSPGSLKYPNWTTDAAKTCSTRSSALQAAGFWRGLLSPTQTFSAERVPLRRLRQRSAGSSPRPTTVSTCTGCRVPVDPAWRTSWPASD